MWPHRDWFWMRPICEIVRGVISKQSWAGQQHLQWTEWTVRQMQGASSASSPTWGHTLDAGQTPGLGEWWCSDAVLSKFASCNCSHRRVLVGTERCIFSINCVCRRHCVSYSAADRADGSWIGFYLDTDLILPLLKQLTIVLCVNITDFPSIMPICEYSPVSDTNRYCCNVCLHQLPQQEGQQ